MSRLSLKFISAGSAVGFLFTGALPAAPDVTVVVDMTPAGRAAVHPTPAHPDYYLPLMRGYQELGAIVSGETPPSPDAVFQLAVTELATRGYQLTDSGHRKPNLVIDFSWGSIHRTEEQDAYNEMQRDALTLGRTIYNVMPLESFGHNEFMAATRDPRYFVVITAYDYAAWIKQKTRVILWKAKMSLPTHGVFLTDVFPSLIKAGGPMFGHETINHPKLVPELPEGRVEVGTPTVAPTSGPPPPPASK
jgi:hypothetical protein